METGAGGTNDGVTGFSHTDTVNFYNPGNGLRGEWIWREHHIGLTLSETEAQGQGILVQDQPRPLNQMGKKDRGMIMLANVLEEANADYVEQYAKTMNNLLWGDGSVEHLRACRHPVVHSGHSDARDVRGCKQRDLSALAQLRLHGGVQWCGFV
ncbi:hypothetical protein P7F88_25545 [Vibrio hannami]|uniref:hypothetical protein n=1 Tax=Vibrio hannami TaxID=2717094 RepID=UPI00240F779C|nr:hypothetical protein [Vibrio hannami]MDG3089231.1 hypothetical protein [Vibrio hannami]